jgi:uncharacterized protein (DUF433 family)
MTPQELQDQALQLPIADRWQLVQTILASLQQEHHPLPLEPDPALPDIAFRSDAENSWVPVIHGTGIQVKTIVMAATQWDWAIEQIAEEYGLSAPQIEAALAFYRAHQDQFDQAIATDLAQADLAQD